MAMPSSCGPDSRPTDPSETLVWSTEHFDFRYTEGDSRNIRETGEALERAHARITRDLGVEIMPRVHVTFHLTHASLADAVRPVTGEIPPWAIGTVTGVDRIHIRSPNVASLGSYADMVTRIVHEFAHCVSLVVNASFGNRPRWLWESVAIYEAGQAVDPRSLPYMARHEPPSFDQLDRFDNVLVYDVGYTIAEFIVSRWSLATLRALIASHGNTLQTLGLSPADFEREWFLFVRQRYGL